jgi:hypothetical protein
MQTRTFSTAALFGLFALVGAMPICAPSAVMAQQNRFDALANLPFKENRPTQETAQTLKDELLFQRATQTYLWGLPLVNTMGMKDGSEKVFGAGYNVLPIWKKRLDAKTLVTTPNSDVIYAMSYVDLGKDGPLVFEAPPNLQGILLDFWQQPIPVDGGKFFGDVGLPGPDAGKGGKFLLLPPAYKGDVPADHYVYRSSTNNVFIFLRSFYQDPKNLAPAVALVEQSKIYPLGKQTGALAMKFPDASGVPANMLPVSDARAFDQLKYLVDNEGTNLSGPDGLGMLASIGIIQGKPFKPDARTRGILDRAASTGAWLDGGKNYTLHVPKDAPVKQFWSFTVYDNESRCLIDSGSYPDRSSRDDITTNADGSVDLYFGPQPPAGKPPKNWIKTLPGKGWFTYFRLYGPVQPYFDKTWVLPDIEEVKQQAETVPGDRVEQAKKFA